MWMNYAALLSLVPAALLLFRPRAQRDGVIWSLLAKNRRALAGLALAVAPFVVLQFWLWRSFGAIGLTSGGYLATPFEWLPYMGLWRVASVSLPALVLLAAISLPIAINSQDIVCAGIAKTSCAF